jgi:hypothetical protein
MIILTSEKMSGGLKIIFFLQMKHQSAYVEAFGRSDEAECIILFYCHCQTLIASTLSASSPSRCPKSPNKCNLFYAVIFTGLIISNVIVGDDDVTQFVSNLFQFWINKPFKNALWWMFNMSGLSTISLVSQPYMG